MSYVSSERCKDQHEQWACEAKNEEERGRWGGRSPRFWIDPSSKSAHHISQNYSVVFPQTSRFISRWLSHSLSCFCPFSFTYNLHFLQSPALFMCRILGLLSGTDDLHCLYLCPWAHVFPVSADTKKGATHWFLVCPEWKMAITSMRTGSCFLFLMSLVKCHNASSGNSADPSTIQNQPTCYLLHQCY